MYNISYSISFINVCNYCQHYSANRHLAESAILRTCVSNIVVRHSGYHLAHALVEVSHVRVALAVMVAGCTGDALLFM